MNLYRISRDSAAGWDEYRSAIVAAETPEGACTIHPDGRGDIQREPSYDSWVPLQYVTATLIGKAAPHIKRGVILADYKAG